MPHPQHSYGTFLKRGSDPVLTAIDERIANWVHIPASHGEDMQVLRYSQNQFYRVSLGGFLRLGVVCSVTLPFTFLASALSRKGTLFGSESAPRKRTVAHGHSLWL